MALHISAVPKTRPLEIVTPCKNFVLTEHPANLRKVSCVTRKSGIRIYTR